MNSTSRFRLRIMMAAYFLWTVVVCLLGAWWGRLLFRQAERIVELENALGHAASLTQDHWQRTQRMLYWESGAFFVSLFACTSFLFWFFWRDMRRVRGLQAFFASVTHELRTPLTSIRLQAESIAENLRAEESQKHLVERLLEDTIRMESQVERTLELARVEGGGPVYTQPIQIKPWLDRSIQTWRVDYPYALQIESSVDDVWVLADPIAVQIIFRNILENSIKHSGRDPVSVKVSNRRDAKGIWIILKDDGCGYLGDPRKIGKLFQRGPLSQGTGVGLYLVKALMSRMRGRAEFEYLTGFEVRLWFPNGDQHG